MTATQGMETSTIGKRREKITRSLCTSLGVFKKEEGCFDESVVYSNQDMQTPKSTSSNSAMSSSKRMQAVDNDSLVLDKEHMQADHLLIQSRSICKPTFQCLNLLIQLCNTSKQSRQVHLIIKR